MSYCVTERDQRTKGIIKLIAALISQLIKPHRCAIWFHKTMVERRFYDGEAGLRGLRFSLYTTLPLG